MKNSDLGGGGQGVDGGQIILYLHVGLIHLTRGLACAQINKPFSCISYIGLCHFLLLSRAVICITALLSNICI